MPMQLVELQCDSLLREKFCVCELPRFHTYTQIYKNYSICLSTVDDVWWHIFVWTTVFIYENKQQLWQSQFNRYSFVTQNFKLTWVNTLRAYKKNSIFWGKKNLLISSVISEWCMTGQSNSVYLSVYLTNLMQKICFTISFISCLYMFRAHVLIIRRSKLYYTASGIITPIGVMIPPDDEHMCSKYVEAWNKTYCETNFMHQVG